MTMVDHVTVHVPAGTLDGDGIERFMHMIDFNEVDANDPLYTHEHVVRWFKAWENPAHPRVQPLIHFVEGTPPPELKKNGVYDQLVLGHICVAMPVRRMMLVSRLAREAGWLARDSGSGRIWLQFANIRVEVRPSDR